MTREKAIKVIKELMHDTCLHSVDQEALETLIPELKDSEDERIRKDIINLIYWLKGNPSLCSQYYKDRYDGILTWLEKQKERGPLTKEEEYELHRIIEFLEDETCPSKWISLLHDISCLPYQKYDEQKEQKQVDYEAELKKCKDNPLYFYDKYVSIKLKPAKWNEEDERMLSRCIKSVECSKQFADSETYKAAKDVEMNWLKSLPERFNFEPKQEWSDEEYGRLFDIEHYLDGTLQLSPDRRIACIDFLKSLRPSWKPSEEQMNGLAHAINLDVYDAKRYGLDSLYNDLKKLM